MNILMPRIRSCRWLDLCCGSGVMGCEAIQRGAKEVVAVEQDRRTARIAERNLQSTAMGCLPKANVAVTNRNVQAWLDANADSAPFDLIYFDPPYGAGLYIPVLEKISQSTLLEASGLLVCEHDKAHALDVDQRSWTIHDHRFYGRTGLLFLTINRPEHCPGGIDSKQPQTTPEA